MENDYVIGIDYGTDSVRSIIVEAITGKEVASSVYYYPRWKDGLYCDPSKNQFRQHPLDYIEGLEQSVKNCLEQAGPAVRSSVRALSIDTTGSTPVAVDESGVPLALHPEWEHNPNAMFLLWKDHTAIQAAADINTHARKYKADYLKYVGGIYSSEWFWAKLLHVLREDPAIGKACYSWVEHCDWMPFLLTGGDHAMKIKRSVCAAGHKALWAEEFGGLPPDDFFSSLDPLLTGFTRRLFRDTYPADQPAGNLSGEWARRLGLSTGVLVGIGALDAHMGAVGGQIEPFYLSKVMGTSTCDMLTVPADTVNNTLVKGICGQVYGSIVPGMVGMEAGQSAFGDTYAWFRDLLAWPLKSFLPDSQHVNGDIQALINEAAERILPALNIQAARIPPDENNELAVDWFNGRRTPDANQVLKGTVCGLNLGSDPPRVFRALAEATCFGAKKIVDRFIAEGVPVKGLIGIGGVAKKSPFIMQMMADIMEMPIRIHRSEQTCALGAAMFAATVAGIYPKVEDAMTAMGQGFEMEYQPDQTKKDIYKKRYQRYAAVCAFIEKETGELSGAV